MSIISGNWVKHLKKMFHIVIFNCADNIWWDIQGQGQRERKRQRQRQRQRHP